MLVSLDVDFLSQLIAEESLERREVIGRVLRRKLTDLNSAMRTRTLAKDQARRDLHALTGSSWQFQPFEGTLMSRKDFDAWLAHEASADVSVRDAISEHLLQRETENRMLREALDRRQSLSDVIQAEDEKQTNDVTDGRRGSTVERMAILEGIIKKQDGDINLLQNQIETEGTRFVHLPKDAYIRLKRHMQPVLGLRGDDVTAFECISDELEASIANLVSQIERLRGRIQQTSSVIVDQQKDREVSLKILQQGATAEELREVLARKVSEWNETRDTLEDEISSLRSNMESLAQYNRTLMDTINKSQEAERERKEAATRRRISAPHATAHTAEEGIRRAAERRKQRRATVTESNQAARVTSVQLSLNSVSRGDLSSRK